MILPDNILKKILNMAVNCLYSKDTIQISNISPNIKKMIREIKLNCHPLSLNKQIYCIKCHPNDINFLEYYKFTMEKVYRDLAHESATPSFLGNKKENITFIHPIKKSWVPLFALKIKEEGILKINGYCCSGTGIRISYA